MEETISKNKNAPRSLIEMAIDSPELEEKKFNDHSFKELVELYLKQYQNSDFLFTKINETIELSPQNNFYDLVNVFQSYQSYPKTGNSLTSLPGELNCIRWLINSWPDGHRDDQLITAILLLVKKAIENPHQHIEVALRNLISNRKSIHEIEFKFLTDIYLQSLEVINANENHPKYDDIVNLKNIVTSTFIEFSIQLPIPYLSRCANIFIEHNDYKSFGRIINRRALSIQDIIFQSKGLNLSKKIAILKILPTQLLIEFLYQENNFTLTVDVIKTLAKVDENTILSQHNQILSVYVGNYQTEYNLSHRQYSSNIHCFLRTLKNHLKYNPAIEEPKNRRTGLRCPQIRNLLDCLRKRLLPRDDSESTAKRCKY